MTSVIVRRRKLGKTSTNGIVAAMQEECSVWRNWMPYRGPAEVDYIFRWGCTSDLPAKGKVLNKAEAIHLVSDKTRFREVLEAAELCPPTWFDARDVPMDEKNVIVRSRTHAQGRGLWMCHTRDTINAACVKAGAGYYINKFIPKVAEYRVFVAQGRAAWVAQKTPGNPDDVAWNVARGGRFDNVRWTDWPLKAVKVSIKAFNLSGLDYGGVDVMIDRDGECYVLEINSAPSQTSPYRQECVAKVFDWIIRNGHKHIGLVEEKGKYLKFIHPALDEKAILP